MSDSRKKLERAFKLIKRDETEEAQKIIRPILDEEPDNVDAWWLLAYAVTEPREVREALLNVLKLDPDYANAPKAREMLDKLNAEYPPSEDEIARFPELASAGLPAGKDSMFEISEFAPSPAFEHFEEADEEPFSEDIFADVFADSQVPEIDDELFVSEDPFSDLRAEALGPEADEGVDAIPHDSEVSSSTLEEEIRLALATAETQLDEEALAALEERAVRRSSRARRLAGLVVALLIVLLIPVAVLVLTRPENEEDSGEPPELETVSVESPSVSNSIQTVALEARTAGLGESSDVVVAKSAMGDALVMRLCDRPSPTLPERIAQAMNILAQQSPTLQDELGAVGVDVSICNGDERDTLFRAFASMSDAQRYTNNEISLTEFQSSWKRL